jgi:hypothetical protein
VKFRGGISNRVVVQGGLVKFPQKKKIGLTDEFRN